MIEIHEGFEFGIAWTIKVHECDDCGWRVEDLEDRIDIEWWSDNRCGCHREVV